jgi:phosphohistidine swiveling domain-containing protein
MTCHAAILAREMDVPFIVGVRDVTDLFGEGDRIEIDFENAVVQSA